MREAPLFCSSMGMFASSSNITSKNSLHAGLVSGGLGRLGKARFPLSVACKHPDNDDC
jgi:hypothetical protein